MNAETALPAAWRKRPRVVEAVQYGVSLPMGPFAEPTPDWIEDAYNQGLLNNHLDECGHWLCVCTLEGDVAARPGACIVRGVEGELYPVRADIFARTYEPVLPTDGALEAPRAEPGQVQRSLPILSDSREELREKVEAIIRDAIKLGRQDGMMRQECHREIDATTEILALVSAPLEKENPNASDNT
jgi:hypothetical protein